MPFSCLINIYFILNNLVFISDGDIDIQNATRLHYENSLEYGWLAMEKLIMIGSTYSWKCDQGEQ